MLEKLNEYINSMQYGIFSFVFETLVILLAIIFVIVVLFKYIQSKKIIIVYLAIMALGIASFLLKSTYATYTIIILLVLSTVGLLVYYIPEIKQFSISKISSKQNKKYLSNVEVKDELIKTLIKSVKHLSERRIGAIITIEKEHSLNTLVQSSVKIDAVVSFELLESIFHTNTALHDGAVIIRGDRIKCASAFYQPSQKKDIPQHYGSRHRAAIGISEQSDAFTIIVSEETGHIATTISGTITGNVSLESLQHSLEQQIIVKTNQ